MYYLLGVLGLVCLLLAVRLYSMDRNLRKGAEELRQRRKEREIGRAHV